MVSLAHIINPVPVDETSDLFIAQPVTFSTMETASEFSGNSIDVKLYAVQCQDEKRIALPRQFIRLPEMTRSVTDVQTFQQKRKLPFIKDILDRLDEATNADFMIYSNVDIALQPYFYQVVSHIIGKGHDAFVINRRTIPDRYTMVQELPLMYAESGEKHPGWDCFIFHKSLYAKFELGNVCIGSGWFGRAMIINMAALAKNFKIFKELHATFHIGNGKSWKEPRFDDYIEHNKNECRKILTDFDEKYGPFDRLGIPGRFFSRL